MFEAAFWKKLVAEFHAFGFPLRPVWAAFGSTFVKLVGCVFSESDFFPVRAEAQGSLCPALRFPKGRGGGGGGRRKYLSQKLGQRHGSLKNVAVIVGFSVLQPQSVQFSSKNWVSVHGSLQKHLVKSWIAKL